MMKTRGILRPKAGFEHFALDRADPPADLVGIVSGLWSVRWDLAEGETFEQEILPFPNVNLAFEDGGLNVHGPTRARFLAKLSGCGWVAGVRFRPAGFYAVSVRPMREVAERVWSAADATGCPAPAFPTDPSVAFVALCEFVQNCREARAAAGLPPVDVAELSQISTLVEQAESDRNIASAGDLARLAGMSVRSLHRVLQRFVGVSCKWIVRRARIQQCAELVAGGERVDWTRTALELGYHDQAHLIRDFKQQIGHTPTAYRAQCAQAGPTVVVETDESTLL